MDVQQLRDSLPITRDTVYLNTGFAGPTPLRVLRRMAETLEQEALLGPASPAGLAFVRQLADGARAAVAELLGASPDEVAITHSTTEGVNVVLHGIGWQPGDELVTSTLEHPAITVPAQVLAERRGVRVVPADISPQASPEEMLSAVRAAITPRTRLVALSHIQFTCGLRMPIKEIAGIAHENGVPVLVDGAQSVGQIRVNVEELGCDFYALSGQKWLMGPVGTGALYARRDRWSMVEPLFTTTQRAAESAARRSPLAHLALVSHSPGLVSGFAEAVRVALETGIEHVERHALALGGLLRKNVAAIPGCHVLGPGAAECACGLVTVGLEGWTPTDLVEALRQRFRIVARVVHDPDGVRFSTAYFNTEDEMGQVASALESLGCERAKLP